MPRRPNLETCMFCTPEQPCEMHAAKKIAKPRAKSAAKAAPVVEEPPEAASPVPSTPPITQSMQESMRAAMQRHARPMPAPAPGPMVEASTDPVMDDAIRALAPILHTTERRRFDQILSTPSTVQERAAAWRERVRRQ